MTNGEAYREFCQRNELSIARLQVNPGGVLLPTLTLHRSERWNRAPLAITSRDALVVLGGDSRENWLNAQWARYEMEVLIHARDELQDRLTALDDFRNWLVGAA
jgi:hypothetical protein